MTRHRADKTVKKADKKADKKERIMSKVLRIVYRTISTHLIHKAVYLRQCAGAQSPLAWARYTGQTRERREANIQ
jgi:hypothetical protein